MAEGVITADGRPLDVDAAKQEAERGFAAAMAAPAGEDKAPPKRAERQDREPPGSEKPRVDRKPRGRPPKAASEAARAVAALSRDERVLGVKGLVQLGAGLCLVGERITKQRAFRADAITLASSADDLAQAVAGTAEHDPRLAAIVDRICAAGPYAALIQVGFQVGMQLAANHGAPMPGATPPEELIRLAEEQGQEAMAA